MEELRKASLDLTSAFDDNLQLIIKQPDNLVLKVVEKRLTTCEEYFWNGDPLYGYTRSEDTWNTRLSAHLNMLCSLFNGVRVFPSFRWK